MSLSKCMMHYLLLALVLLVGFSAMSASAAAEGTASASTTKDKVKEPVPLPLPENPNVTCGKAVFLEFTKIYTCPWDNWPVDNPDKYCCMGLQDYFGMTSQKPSRNCFCAPEVWGRLTAEQLYHRMPFTRIFRTCSNMGYIVPFYQDGLGYCNGTKDDPYEPYDLDAHYVAKTPGPTFSNWASRLHKDWLMMTSFITGIISVPGFFVFLWPFAFDFVHMVKDSVSSSRSRAFRV